MWSYPHRDRAGPNAGGDGGSRAVWREWRIWEPGILAGDRSPFSTQNRRRLHQDPLDDDAAAAAHTAGLPRVSDYRARRSECAVTGVRRVDSAIRGGRNGLERNGDKSCVTSCPSPGSTKPVPAGYVLAAHVGSSPSYTVSTPVVTDTMLGPGCVCQPLCPPGGTVLRTT